MFKIKSECHPFSLVASSFIAKYVLCALLDRQQSIHFLQAALRAYTVPPSGKDTSMKNPSDLYEDVALAYTRLVRQESQEAADTIEHIRADFGTHAALRAALIITLLKMEVQQNHWVPGIGLYAHLLADYPDALLLTRHAMLCCLQSWAAPIVETGEWIPLAVA